MNILNEETNEAEELHCVYILVKKNGHSFKIGKTQNLYGRITDLERHWGVFNKKRSSIYLGTSEEISNLERLLHRLFAKFRINNLKNKDGFTEFFRIEALNLANKFMSNIDTYEIYVKHFSLEDFSPEDWVTNSRQRRVRKELKLNKNDELEFLFDYNFIEDNEIEIKYGLSPSAAKKYFLKTKQQLTTPNKISLEKIRKLKKSLLILESAFKELKFQESLEILDNLKCKITKVDMKKYRRIFKKLKREGNNHD